MALSARVPSTAQTNYFVPTVFAKEVIDAVQSELVAWDAIKTSWRTDLTKGYVLYIPVTNTISATEVVVGSEGSLGNPMNTTGVALTINEWWQGDVGIDYMTLGQSQLDLGPIAVSQTAYAVQKKIDSTVCALFSSLGGYSTSAYGSDGQTFTDDIAIYLVETLREADVPTDRVADLNLICDPSTQADLFKIDKFLSDQFATKGAVTNGILGRSIYGFMARVTNNLTAATTGSYGCLLHRDAIAGAAQIIPEMTWVEEERRKHRRIYHTEALWGVIEARDTFGVPFFTRKA